MSSSYKEREYLGQDHRIRERQSLSLNPDVLDLGSMLRLLHSTPSPKLEVTTSPWA